MTMNASRQRGLTLIELLIAITLSSLIIAALASLYIGSSRAFREDDQYARMLENGRFAMRFLSTDLQMADFWGYYMLSDSIPGASATVCGVNPYQTQSGAYGAVQVITELPGCEGALSPFGLLIRRVGGPPVPPENVTPPPSGTPTTLEANRAYLEIRAELKEVAYVHGGGGSSYTVDAPDSLWEYRSVAYYLDDSDADGTLELCRRSFEKDPPEPRECLISGIEDWQFLWSLDTNSDGRADTVESSSTVTPNELRGAVGVRICLLLRSEDELRNFNNDKTYTLCGDTKGPYNDGRLRRVFEMNVELRNAVNTIRFRSF